MQHSILLFIFLTFLTFFNTGCGGSSSDRDERDKPVIITYDLSQYIVPSESQTNVYLNRVYEKKEGEKEYREINTTYYNETYEVNASVVQMRDGETYKNTYTVNGENITIVDLIAQKTSIVKRYVKIGDIIFEETSTDEVEGLEVQIDYECKITRHLEEKIVEDSHNDVLQVSCTEKSNGNGTVSNINIKVVSHSTESYYLAKGTGKISSFEERCDTVTVGGSTSTSKCKKMEIELLTIVK